MLANGSNVVAAYCIPGSLEAQYKTACRTPLSWSALSFLFNQLWDPRAESTVSQQRCQELSQGFQVLLSCPHKHTFASGPPLVGVLVSTRCIAITLRTG